MEVYAIEYYNDGDAAVQIEGLYASRESARARIKALHSGGWRWQDLKEDGEDRWTNNNGYAWVRIVPMQVTP